MKLFATRIAVASTLALSLLASSLMPAQAQQFDSYDSGVQVQNLEGQAGVVTLKSYTETGTETTVVADDPIAANGSNTYYGAGLPLQEGFKGSMVVSANVQVAAIANINTPGFTAAASYLAASEGATTVQLPLLMKNNSGYNTWFAVQNTGSAPTTIDIAYSDGVSINDVEIAPGAAKTFYQADENHGDNDREVFSAIITSDSQPIVAAVIEENPETMFAYTGFTGGSTNPVMPLINYQPAINYQTGVQILNGGNQSTNVTVTYTPSPGAGTQCTETQTIPAGQSRTFALGAFAPGEQGDPDSNCLDGQLFVGAAEVTTNSANQPLTAIVNQFSPQNGEAYGGFNPADATAKVVFPLVMDRNGGAQFWTGFNVMNVGDASTTVTCTYTGSDVVETQNLAAGAVMTRLQNGRIAENYVGSATCTSSNASVGIVGVVNELSQVDPNLDRLLVYEGANVAP